MDAVAITDHGVMFGAIEFYYECEKEGIKPIIGCEVYVDPKGHTRREGQEETTSYFWRKTMMVTKIW